LNERKKKRVQGSGFRVQAGVNADSPMNLGLLEQITRLMRENDLNTVELRDGEKRVIVTRGAPVIAQTMPAAQPPALPASAGSASTLAAPSTTSTEESNLHPIKSPMVGTFYASSGPDAKPFVSVGSTVDEDTDVCIIEAMKVFNNIKAEIRGTISKILVTNGQTVEFGQTLFLVKPS
jgi:acetyl-CoA carboxylase biotin carboxyl carrier protein